MHCYPSLSFLSLHSLCGVLWIFDPVLVFVLSFIRIDPVCFLCHHCLTHCLSLTRSQRKVLHAFPGHGGSLGEARFHPAGNLLVSSGEDCMVKFWNVSTAEQLPDLVHELKLDNPPSCISFSPGGGRLAGTVAHLCEP